MVNAIVEPLMNTDHVGYHILHWLISQSGLWYTKINENLQHNLRTIESGVSVIDEILTPQDDDFYFYENNQFGNDNRLLRFYYHQQQCHNLNDNREDDNCEQRVNDNENGIDLNQLQRNDQLLGIYLTAIFTAVALATTIKECERN